jgi:hypothetical protein
VISAVGLTRCEGGCEKSGDVKVGEAEGPGDEMGSSWDRGVTCHVTGGFETYGLYASCHVDVGCENTHFKPLVPFYVAVA